MSSTRSTYASTLHLFAELARFPFASECAFRAHLTTLSPKVEDSTGEFWRQVENEMVRSNPSFSVDEIVNLRDFVWFPEQANGGGLAALLRSLPARCLEVEGATVRPRLPEELATPGSSGADARDFWRWLLLALPPDLLLAAMPGGPPPCRSVGIVSPRLDRELIDRGFAQVHLHFGAASDFTDLWVGVLLSLAHPPPGTGTLFGSPGAIFEEGRELDGWLLRGALARFLLAAYLADHKGTETFEEWLRRAVLPLLGASVAVGLKVALRELAQGRREVAINLRSSEVRALYTRLTGITVRKMPKHAREIQGLDPIARFFSASSSLLVPTPEMRFVAAGLGHLEALKEGTDDLFSRLFWQGIRLRGLFYRYLTQAPSTPGLLWFFRFYNRIKTARIWGTAVQIESTAMLEGIDRGLKHLELRTAPSASIAEMRDVLLQTEIAVQALEEKIPANERTLEVGLILHFTRDRGGGTKEGTPKNRWAGTYADPSYKRTGWRYSVYYQMKRREACALALLLQRHPAALYRLRGLDICTDEVGVPTWVLVPLFRHVHEAGRDASAYLQEACPHLYAPALRSTVHAGEDFAHLMTGLRRITEAIEHLPLKEGDRLGHAVALGLDPVDWAQRVGTAVVCVEERLFDLVWEWGWYAHDRVSPPDSRRSSFLQRQIAKLSREIFGSPQSPDVLEQMVKQLHDPMVLRRIGFPTRPPIKTSANSECALLVQYLTDPEVFRRGRELEWIRAADEAEVLSAIQSKLMVHVGAHGVVVEVNPSSNQLIGDLRDLERHPLWRLSPPRDGASTPPLSICIGSDDPVTFATTLREEYQRLIDALVMGGHSQEEAERWLDRVREQGRISRFTLPRREEALPLDRPPRMQVRSLAPLP